MRGWSRILFAALVTLVAMSAPAWAQATLAGVVKDTSGAVLPGVTVEASSPVLIEKARTAVTDGTGRYQIIDLRPGTYDGDVHADRVCDRQAQRRRVERARSRRPWMPRCASGTCPRPSRSAAKRPIVDLQTTTRQTVMDQKIVAAIPTSRNSFAVGVLIPGVDRVATASARFRRRRRARPDHARADGARQPGFGPAADGERRRAEHDDWRRMGRRRRPQRDRDVRVRDRYLRASMPRRRPAACGSTSSRATAATSSAAPSSAPTPPKASPATTTRAPTCRPAG